LSAEIIPIQSYDTNPAPPETETALAPILHFVHVQNPLMPATSRRASAFAWEKFKTVAAYLDEAFPLGHGLMVVSLNGRVLSGVEREHVLPRAGDWLVASPRVLGGSVWRTLAMVAVMAASIALPAFLIAGVAAWSFAGSTAVAMMLGGAVSIAGNLLINTFMGLNPASKAQSPSWAFSGPKTLAQPGVVIPKGYGKFVSGGNVIGSFVDIEGSNQYINALVCYGFGPARSIANLQLNGKSIDTYRDVQVYTRLGSNDQTAIPGFNRIVNGYPQAVQVTCAGGPVVVPGTGDLTQALQVDIEFSAGVYYVSGAGNNLPCKVVYKVEYAPHGTSDWQAVLQPRTTQDVIIYHTDGTIDWGSTPTWVLLWDGAPAPSGIVLQGDHGSHTPGDAGSVTQTVTLYNADGSSSTSSQTFTGEWQPTDPTINQVEVLDWFDGWVQYVNDTTMAVYNRTSIYGLAPGKYDVRVTKWGSYNADNTIPQGDYDSPRRGQEVWIHSVNEITYQDLNYPNMILVGVRALATNQLSGANINITAEIDFGLRTLDSNILPAALQAFEENNPACVAADMMLDPLYGGGAYPGIKPTNIERFIDEWVAWAENNETLVPDGNGNSIRLHVFNGVFDNESDLWQQAQTVGRMSRASIIPMGRDYGVFVNKDDVPVQMFSVGNIKQDSFEETWMALDDRANQVEVEFADSTRSYQVDNPLVYMDAADQAAGAIVKNVRVRATGVTIPAQAWHYGHFLGVCNKLLLRTGKFDCDVDAIACRPGNLVILQHDVPQWGWGGRTMPGAAAGLVTVDRNDLPWDGSTAYNLIALFPSIQRYAGTVSAVSTSTDSTGLTIGTLLTLSSFDNTHRVTRAVVAGVDCPILQSISGQVLVTPPPGFTPTTGMAYTLFDTDVLETATVSGVAAGENNTQVLTLGTPFTQAPADFSVYFYGQPGSQKVVRITNIKRLSEFRASIEWIDNDPNAYTIGTPVVGETSAQSKTKPGVTNLTAIEVFKMQTSGNYLDMISLAWKNGQDTAGVGIYGSYPGLAAPKMLARLTGQQTGWQYQVAPDVEWTFTVVGFDQNGEYAAWATAPSVTITAEGITTNLLQDSSFQSGFAYWNLTPRASDSLVPTFTNDGEAEYTVAGTAITATQPLINQVIPASKWSVGTPLMLSAYFEATGTPTGNLVADLCFFNSLGDIISTARAVVALAGAAQLLIREHTALTNVPTGTTEVRVRVLVDGTVSLPIGTVIKVHHLLLEVAVTGQTNPSVWADLDASGKLLDTFQSGNSSSLRTQGSLLPSSTGGFPFTSTDTTLEIDYTGVKVDWPDSGQTEVEDGALTISSLTASNFYFLYLYFDIINGGVKAVYPALGVGSPAIATIVYDPAADALCKLDGRVPLTPGGLRIPTAASGGTGGGSGGIVSVVVSPNIVTLGASDGTQSFTATVSGAPYPDVVWSVYAGGGTIDSSGNFTGPGGGLAGGCTVKATSVADGSCYGTAHVSWPTGGA
jgi:hypothetical protein